MTWLEIIIESISRLGGHAEYSDLYSDIEMKYPDKINGLKDFKAQIRGTIERHSSDSKVYHSYKPNEDKDIFYAVHGIGSGHWGLRNFIPNDDKVDITEDDSGFKEGKLKLRLHVYRERNFKVIDEAKKIYKEKHGRLLCQVCNFDFEDTYGSIGIDFIEGHHVIPVSELSDDSSTRIEDIAMLCSNCHKMVHRKRPWLSMDDLNEIIKK